jgi:hypothetical protein
MGLNVQVLVVALVSASWNSVQNNVVHRESSVSITAKGICYFSSG